MPLRGATGERANYDDSSIESSTVVTYISMVEFMFALRTVGPDGYFHRTIVGFLITALVSPDCT